MSIKTIERRIAALKDRLPKIPGFAEFQRQWECMDELSRSLIEFEAACEDQDTPYLQAVRAHLGKMGLLGKRFSLVDAAKDLRSDTLTQKFIYKGDHNNA